MKITIAIVLILTCWTGLFALEADEISNIMTPNEFICKALRSHGEKCEIVDDYVLTGNSNIKIYGHIKEGNLVNGRYSAQFDVSLDLGNNRVITEQNVGFGESYSLASQDSYLTFLSGSFHAMLAGALRHKCEHVSLGEMIISGINRTVTFGEIQLRGVQMTLPPNLSNWYEKLKNDLPAINLSPGTHWIRILVVQINNEVVLKQFLVDNEPSEWGMQWLNKFDWPKSTNFYSQKSFIVINDK